VATARKAVRKGANLPFLSEHASRSANLQTLGLTDQAAHLEVLPLQVARPPEVSAWGRGLFPSDEKFGQWLVSNNLRLTENDKMERAAAMWAAANQDNFDMARAARDGCAICSPSVPPDRKSKSPLARACCK